MQNRILEIPAGRDETVESPVIIALAASAICGGLVGFLFGWWLGH